MARDLTRLLRPRSIAVFGGKQAAEVVRAVQELVDSFSGGELKDDVTILAVRVSLGLLVQVLDHFGAAGHRAARGGAGSVRVLDEVVLLEQGRPGRQARLQRLGVTGGVGLLGGGC